MPPGWEFERAAGIVVWTGDPTPPTDQVPWGLLGVGDEALHGAAARHPPPSEYKRLCCWDRLVTVVHIETDD